MVRTARPMVTKTMIHKPDNDDQQQADPGPPPGSDLPTPAAPIKSATSSGVA